MGSRTHKKVLVTGACRSGTTTVTRFLKDAGLQVEHEQMGPDGTVSCMFFIDASYYPKGGIVRTHEGDGKFSDYEFEHIIHLVRHPLEAIPSQAGIYSAAHKKWLDEIGLVNINVKPNLLHAAKLWKEVNTIVDSMTKAFIRIEDLENFWPALKRRLGLKGEMPEIRQMNKASGIFSRPSIEWEHLEMLDKELANDIKRLTRNYGYLQ